MLHCQLFTDDIYTKREKMGTATQTLACTVESSLFVGDQFS